MDRGIKIPQNPSEWGFKGENYLLIIGIDTYTHWKPLNNAVKDVRDISKLLTERYQFQADKTITLLNEEATEENIRKTLRDLKRLITTEDNLILFYSGHGDYDEELDEGYWIPANARKDYPTDYISNSDVLKWVKAIKTHHSLILVDSCFSGTLVQQSRGDVLSEKYPSCRIFASGRKELVDDGMPGKNSPFAQAILNRLSYNTDRVMRASELIQNVTKTVESHAGQSPIEGRIKDAGDEGGEFVFHLKITEDEIWNAVLISNTKEEYSKYIEYYPSGRFASDAKNKIAGFDDRMDWTQAIQFSDKVSIKNYLIKHPHGFYYKDGIELLSKIEENELWNHTINRNTESAYLDYLFKYPNGQYIEIAKKNVEAINDPIKQKIKDNKPPIKDQVDEPIWKLKEDPVDEPIWKLKEDSVDEPKGKQPKETTVPTKDNRPPVKDHKDEPKQKQPKETNVPIENKSKIPSPLASKQSNTSKQNLSKETYSPQNLKALGSTKVLGPSGDKPKSNHRILLILGTIAVLFTISMIIMNFPRNNGSTEQNYRDKGKDEMEVDPTQMQADTTAKY